jgi:membrane peptidoglycan carboxypeptidase
MCEFLIVGEDRRFYRHLGVDVLALCRAVWKTVFCGSRQGASTIAMQLVRTIMGRHEKTWRRKLIEIILAMRLSQRVSKDRLPVLYLWVAYYGWGMNNFRQACSRLGIDPRSVSIFEAAKLVARLKYPEPSNFDAERLKKIYRRALHLITLANRTNQCLYSYSRGSKWSHSKFQSRSKI